MSLTGWSFILSCLAVVISLAALRYARQQAVHSGTMARLDVERREESKRLAASAQLFVAIVRPKATRTELQIQNVGQAPARGLDLTIDGAPGAACPFVWPSDRALVPVSVLAPGARIGLGLTTFDGSPSVLHVALTWHDDSSLEPRRWESAVAWS
jgi:hypothetical protein